MSECEPPTNEIPVRVPLDLVLNRTEDLILWMSDVHVYSTGFVFTVCARERVGAAVLDMYGFGYPSWDGSSAPLLVGIEYADGTVTSNLPCERFSTGLEHNGSASQAGSGWVSYFQHPLPARGPVRIVTAWPWFSVPEQVVEVDGRVLAEAATAVETLWPAIPGSEPPTGGSDSRVLPLYLEPGGWFDTVARPAAEKG